MLILVQVDAESANQSHRSPMENVEVDINDNIETVKVKISMVYTAIDPSKITLEIMGYRCQPTDIILNLKKRFPSDPMTFRAKEGFAACCLIMWSGYSSHYLLYGHINNWTQLSLVVSIRLVVLKM